MIGIFIVARLGSTRLHNKHLITVAQKSFIEWLVLRMVNEFGNEIKTNRLKIFITTSTNPENKKFEYVLRKQPVTVFYGSNSNIPLRQLQCAIENNINYIISIDGDDILCSVDAARKVMDKLVEGHDILKTEGLPLGMNVMGYATKFLQQALNSHTNQQKLETGWGRIFPTEQIKIVNYNQRHEQYKLRFTLDYIEDAEFFKKIINDLKDNILFIDDSELIKYVFDNQIFKINSFLNDEYWNNFTRETENEN